MTDAFDRLSARLFAHFGQQAFLRGDPVTAIIEHGIAVTGDYGEVTAFRSLATLPSASKPRGGDTLLIDGRAWTIDAIEIDDGYTTRCFLR